MKIECQKCNFHPAPFLVLNLIGWLYTLMASLGRVEVTIHDPQSRVFVGIPGIGWTRRFHWSDVKIIRLESKSRHSRAAPNMIALFGQSQIYFGSNLSKERRDFILNALTNLKTLQSKN